MYGPIKQAKLLQYKSMRLYQAMKVSGDNECVLGVSTLPLLIRCSNRIVKLFYRLCHC